VTAEDPQPRKRHVGPVTGLSWERLTQLGAALYDRITGDQRKPEPPTEDHDLPPGHRSEGTEETGDGKSSGRDA
jgi:hypothetical protein